jgi:hypothetical protein
MKRRDKEYCACHGDERWSPPFKTPALEPPFHKNGLLPKISVQSILAPTTWVSKRFFEGATASQGGGFVRSQ